MIKLHRRVVAGAVAVLALGSVPAQAQTPAPLPAFFADVARDYRNMVSWDTAQWLSIGGVAALFVAEADEALRVATEDPAAPPRTFIGVTVSLVCRRSIVTVRA